MTENKKIENNLQPSRQDVHRMFDRIAGRYDLLNRLLSMRRDVAWRKKVGRLLPDKKSITLLDLATGTGDLILSLMNQNNCIDSGVGLDMSSGMLDIAQKKINSSDLKNKLTLVRSDASSIPFAGRSFDAVTIAFGIRNVIDVNVALKEMHRVLKPGGKVLILEFSLPPNRLIRSAYMFYFRHILPRIGSVISGDSQAYRYLNQTVETFPCGDDFLALMKQVNFDSVICHPQTLGIASIYEGVKN